MSRRDLKVEKWHRWIEKIVLEIRSLVVAREIFRALEGMMQSNARLQEPPLVRWYLHYTYEHYAIMCVRRYVKHQKDSVSLAGLLSEIVDDPLRLSREHYRKRCKDLFRSHWVDAEFDRFCKVKGAAHISQEMVKKDLAKLKAVTKSCADFADQRIAHFDSRTLNDLPDFRDLDQAVDVLHDVCLKYQRILKADTLTSLLPEFRDDWQVVFDFPWRLPEEKFAPEQAPVGPRESPTNRYAN